MGMDFLSRKTNVSFFETSPQWVVDLPSSSLITISYEIDSHVMCPISDSKLFFITEFSIISAMNIVSIDIYKSGVLLNSSYFSVAYMLAANSCYVTSDTYGYLRVLGKY